MDEGRDYATGSEAADERSSSSAPAAVRLENIVHVDGRVNVPLIVACSIFAVARAPNRTCLSDQIFMENLDFRASW